MILTTRTSVLALILIFADPVFAHEGHRWQIMHLIEPFLLVGVVATVVWAIVAFFREMSRLVEKDARPARRSESLKAPGPSDKTPCSE
jgi:hypothetical protein